jgi:hypothetical protein
MRSQGRQDFLAQPGLGPFKSGLFVLVEVGEE